MGLCFSQEEPISKVPEFFTESQVVTKMHCIHGAVTGLGKGQATSRIRLSHDWDDLLVAAE
eukprot:759839-Hanusia_phi.AAC.4